MKESKNLLIAGAGGYIGTTLVDEALRSGRTVTALDTYYFGRDKLKRHVDSPNLTIVEGDIRDVGIGIFRGIDEVVNLAGISNDSSCDLLPELTESTNLTGCIRLARLAKEAGIRRFVDMSSCSVYGRGDEDICNENTTPRPVSLYAKCKLGVEESVLPLGTNDFCITSLRNSTTFAVSDRMRFDLVVNIMAFHAQLRKFIKISGNGEQGRPLVHVRDVADACLQILGADQSLINGETFNLVGCNMEIREIAESVRRVVSRMIDEEIQVDYFPQDFDVRSYKVDGSKLQNTLGISPKRKVENAVVEIIEGLQSGDIQDSPDCYTVQFYKKLFPKK